MKILVIIHNQFGSGPFLKVLEMCAAISSLGTDITLLCTSNTSKFFLQKEQINKILVVKSPDLLWGSLRQGIDIWNISARIIYIAGQKYDIVNAIDTRPVVILPALIVKYFKKSKLVLNWWDWFGREGTASERSSKLFNFFFGGIETFFEEYFRKFADYSFVVSSKLYKRLCELEYNKKNISLIRVGAFNDQLNYTKIEARKLLNLPIDKKILCYAGTIFKRDNQFLIEALCAIRDRVKEIPLIILIGKHDISNEVCTLLNIRLVGKLNEFGEVLKYFSASDFGIIPMKSTIANLARWPSKISDYFSMNLPIISTPISDLKEISKTYTIGLISKDDTLTEFVCSIESALALSDTELLQCQSGVREYFEKELNWNVIANETVKIFDELL